MEKKSKIRILKDNKKNDHSYTFVLDEINKASQISKASRISEEVEVNAGTTAVDVDNLNQIHEKKKVLTNEDVRKASKGLKFNNPSQRNHSSIYE